MWLVCDKDGEVFLFKDLPYRDKVNAEDTVCSIWSAKDVSYFDRICLGTGKDSGFDISWENEPIEVDIIVKDTVNIKVADDTRWKLERDSGKTIEQLQRSKIKHT